MTTVLATGSSTDPLITKSYLEGTYATSLKRDADATLAGAVAGSMSRLDEIYRGLEGYEFAPRFTRIALAARDTVTLTTGGSFTLTSGSAMLQITSGTVINASTGTTATSGANLRLNNRYFCTENTTATITASSSSEGYVDGLYKAGVSDVIPPTTLPFTDVSATDWYFDAVSFVYTNNLFGGTSATTFSPGLAMTRGMFVTVLHRLDGTPAAGTGGGFSDVRDPAQYYYDAVAWANTNKIVEGYSDGTFKPNLTISREQMATIMHRYAAYKNKNMSSSSAAFDAFPDKDAVSSYATQAVRWAVSWEIIRGSGGRILPQNTATRAEVAQIVVNYYENFG